MVVMEVILENSSSAKMYQNKACMGGKATRNCLKVYRIRHGYVAVVLGTHLTAKQTPRTGELWLFLVEMKPLQVTLLSSAGYVHQLLHIKRQNMLSLISSLSVSTSRSSLYSVN